MAIESDQTKAARKTVALGVHYEDIARVNRDAATRTGVGLAESDKMGAKRSIRRLESAIRFHGFGSTHCYPSTGCFAFRILTVSPNEVEHVTVAA